jgi:putative transposase
MPQSLANVLLHVIFSTKNREPFLENLEFRKAVHAYLTGTLKNLECPALTVDGVADHVHILCLLSRKITIADLVEETKVASSKWIKTSPHSIRGFHWQNGYAVFSVSQSNVLRVRKYIDDQESHHRQRTFQEELRAFLKRHQIQFDERYVWD